MVEKLEKYINNEIIYIKPHNKKAFLKLGMYINDNLDIEKIYELDIFYERSKRNFITDSNNIYSSLGIMFLTDTLNEEALRKMFGEPLLHNEFGEGFEGEWDDESEDYLDPEIKETYASYFLEIKNIDIHIGYDHRGTTIEVDLPIEEDSDEKIYEVYKELVDIFNLSNCSPNI